MIEPGLYSGEVMHRRMTAPPHRFAYRSFWIAVDLDAPPRLRLFSLDRANLFSLHARDQCGRRARPVARENRGLRRRGSMFQAA